MQKSLLLLLLLLIVFSIFFTKAVYAQNPLLRKSNENQEERVKKNPYPSFVQKFIVGLSKFQKTLNEKLSELARNVKETKNIAVFFWLICIAFLYGIIHALGPGHGKFVALSYFLSEKAEVKKGILVGSAIGYLHAFSGFITVMIIYTILKHSYLTTVENVSVRVQAVSYGLIILVGLALLIKNIFFEKRPKDEQNISMKSMIAMIVAIGLVPCPGAVILTLFSISLQSIFLGAVMVLAMATGMAVTISLIGVLTIVLKRDALRLFAKQSDLQWHITKGVQIFGSVAIIMVGVLLFLSVV